MMAPTCVRCGRPTADGYACSPCAYRAGDQLHDIADMAPAARDIAHGFARHGDSGAGAKPGSRMPLDTMATQKLDQIQARLSTWVGEIANARNRPIPAPRHLGHDPIVLWARWLAGHVEWMRKTDDAERFLIEVDECARVIRGVARGPSEQRFLGPCGATITWDDDGSEVPRETPCEGDVYAHPGATNGTCGACKARWLVTNRAAWIEEQTADLAAPARDIAYALGVSVKTIRSWATEIQAPNGTVIRKAKLRTFCRVDEHVVPWIEPAAKLSEAERKAVLAERGPRLHYVGDVRDLAREAAVRRAENEAKRARDDATREDAA